MNDLETLPQPLSLNVRVIVDALPVLELIDLGRTRHFTCASLMVSIVIMPSWTKIRECLTCQYDKSVSMNQWGINVLTAAVARPSPPTSFPMGDSNHQFLQASKHQQWQSNGLQRPGGPLGP